MMNLSILIDISILVIVLAFVFVGVKHGFVRALCSLLAVFVVFFGALFLSRSLSGPITNLAAPHVLPSIIQKLESAPLPPAQGESFTDTEALLLALGLPQPWADMLERVGQTQSAPEASIPTPAQFMALSLLRIAVSALLFVLSFLLLLLAWTLVSRSLGLVARLPVLNFCNRILGAVFGLLKAVLFIFLLRWLLVDLLGLIPAATLSESFAAQMLNKLFLLLPFGSNFLL